jgi:hypothetical protein
MHTPNRRKDDMATTRKTMVDKAGRTIEMQSTPDRPFDPAFDSFLVLHENGCDNHTLTLVLKVHMKQVVPTTLTLPPIGPLTLPFPDFNKRLFAIKPWTPADFAAFSKGFLSQCAHWTHKFWLTPPAGFTGLDYKHGGRTVRPNIYCHLFVDLVGSPGGAHRTIEVVNLDQAAAARNLSKPVGKLDASDFRSTDRTYDSLDTKPVPIPFPDDKGKSHSLNRSTIAHEVGHALGLPHAGVSQGAPGCGLAVVADALLPKSVKEGASFPGILKGGSNSNACYGHSGPVKVGSNVMGYGLEFDETNATPWLDRIALHTGTKAKDWKVSVKHKIPPKFL